MGPTNRPDTCRSHSCLSVYENTLLLLWESVPRRHEMDLMPAYGVVCIKVWHIEHLVTAFKALQQYFVLNRRGRGQRWKNWQWLQSVILGRGDSRKAPVIIFSIMFYSLPVNSWLFLKRDQKINFFTWKPEDTRSSHLQPGASSLLLPKAWERGHGILIWVPFGQCRENLPSALKQDQTALKLIGNNSGSAAGWKESKEELWAEFRRQQQNPHLLSLTHNPDFPSCVDSNQTNLRPSEPMLT